MRRCSIHSFARGIPIRSGEYLSSVWGTSSLGSITILSGVNLYPVRGTPVLTWSTPYAERTWNQRLELRGPLTYCAAVDYTFTVESPTGIQP